MRDHDDLEAVDVTHRLDRVAGMASTSRSLDRLVTFVDAIVAIAITLLVVPLVEPVAEAARTGIPPAEFLTDNAYGLLAAAISFAVIARLWLAHHALFEHVIGYTRQLAALTILWAGTIAFLPLPTVIAAEFDPDRVSVALYIGTMALSSLLLTLTALYVRGRPDLQDPASPMTAEAVRASTTITVGFTVALVGGLLVPAWSYWWLFALFVVGQVDRVLAARRAR